MQNNEIREAVLENDAAAVAEIFDKFGIFGNGIPPQISAGTRDVANVALSFASAAEWRGGLNNNVRNQIINRTAMMVDIFRLLGLVATGAGIRTEYCNEEDYDDVPTEILEALLWDGYDEEIAAKIDKLEIEAFEALIAFFVNGEVTNPDAKFNLPIIWYIHKNRMVVDELLFAFMAICI